MVIDQLVDFFAISGANLLILVLGGFSAGVINAIAGGGGIISYPCLLIIGLPIHEALATNKLQSVCGSISASYQYLRSGYIDFSQLRLGIVVSLIGAMLGSTLALLVKVPQLKLITPILLSLAFLHLLLQTNNTSPQAKLRMNYYLFFITLGSGLGFYDGFFGPGTGSLWIVALGYFLGYPTLKALGNTKVFNIASNLGALLVFGPLGLINFKIALLMGVMQIIGSAIGARLVVIKGSKLVRPFLMLVVFATILKVSYDFYF